MITTADANENWATAPLAEVCRTIGSAMLHTSRSSALQHESDMAETDRHDVCPPNTTPRTTGATAQLGAITLRPHQIDAVQRIAGSLATHGGALLADSVGLGKTFVALALARQFATVDILAPAALLPMWRSALATTEISHASLLSVHRFSRATSPRHHRTTSLPAPRLVIIDEAHYLRTRNTNRFRHVADFCANAQVLLISATPLHNRPRELRTLLSLFLGARADALDAQVLAACLIRRSSAHVALSIPAVHAHPPMSVPANLPVLEAILTVAPPLPTNEGAAAGALVRLGLLRAWCSSDAALTDTLRRRQLRGEAMLHSLAHGRYPTQRELRSWIVGSDAIQLGFPELLVQSADNDCAPLLATLTTHLDSLNALLQLHTLTSHTDTTRVAYLRSLLTISDAPHIIAFSQFATTIRALHRALGDIAGVASLTSDGGRIASGTLPREAIIARFSPRSNGKPPPVRHEEIRLLLSTDLLAEGVNLQDANALVHLDLPWTDALRQQRVGRLVRMQSRHDVVHVHTFAPPVGTERALAIASTLERKAGFHREWIGRHSSDTDARDAHSAADAGTDVRGILQSWIAQAGDTQCNAPDGCIPAHGTPDASSTKVSNIPAPFDAFVAAVELNGSFTLLAERMPPAASGKNSAHHTSRRQSSHTLPSDDFRDVLPVLRVVDAHWRGLNVNTGRSDIEHPAARVHCERMRYARMQLDRLFAVRAAERVSGPSSRGVSPVQERALRQLASRVAAMPSTSRALQRHALAHAELQITSARTAGAEQRIAAWLAIAGEAPFSEWITAVPALAPASVGGLHSVDTTATENGRVLAIVLLCGPHE